jgi:hypothetical protein
MKSRDSSVGIVTGYGLEDRGSGVRFPEGVGNFSRLHYSQTGSGTHPASRRSGCHRRYVAGIVTKLFLFILTSGTL